MKSFKKKTRNLGFWLILNCPLSRLLTWAPHQDNFSIVWFKPKPLKKRNSLIKYLSPIWYTRETTDKIIEFVEGSWNFLKIFGGELVISNQIIHDQQKNTLCQFGPLDLHQTPPLPKLWPGNILGGPKNTQLSFWLLRALLWLLV